MTEHLEAPQLCEGAERLGESRQPKPSIRAFARRSKQPQLLEAPCELPEGLDVGLKNFSGDALDDERAQPTGGDDGFPQRLPERLLAQLFEAATNPKFG